MVLTKSTLAVTHHIRQLLGATVQLYQIFIFQITLI